MEKIFEMPAAIVVVFDNEDVITSSGVKPTPKPEDPAPDPEHDLGPNALPGYNPF